MFQMTAQSKTKIGAMVTSVVLLAACSHKQVKQEAQAFQTPEPIVESTYVPVEAPVPYTRSAGYLKKQKKKTKYAKARKANAGKAKRKSLAAKKRSQLTAVAAQVKPQNPLPPAPPAFMEPLSPGASLSSRAGGHWGFWAVLTGTIGLLALAYRLRQNRARRRLIFN